MSKKLSIIVPVYNMATEGKLNYCLDSLVGQTVIQFSLCRHIIDGYDDTQLFTHTVPRSTFALPSSTR